MKPKKLILPAVLCGAVIGVQAANIGFDAIIGKFPGLALDQSLVGHRGLLAVGVAVWGLFGVYWEIAAKNAAVAKSSESPRSRALHVVLVNVALILEIVPIRGLGRFLPASSAIMAAGIEVEAIGLFLAIWARRHLGRNWSGEISIKEAHQLIRSGPYRRLRHPIYTGLLSMYLGMALVTGEWLAAIGLALAVFSYWRKIRLEEVNLEVAFGDNYDDYRRTSWALVPGLF